VGTQKRRESLAGERVIVDDEDGRGHSDPYRQEPRCR
jgi:hypothetical protein